MRSTDVYFHHCLYASLVDAGATDVLLGLADSAPHLEPWLAQVGL